MRTQHGRMRGNMSFGKSLAVGLTFVAFAVVIALLLGVGEGRAHEWYPTRCCFGHDCAPIEMKDVRLTPQGFVIPGNPEVVPYDSPKIRQTPPEGGNRYHLCSRGGTRNGAVICLYIPNWGS